MSPAWVLDEGQRDLLMRLTPSAFDENRGVWAHCLEFLAGREAIQQFLTRKRAKEMEYRLIKELWACQGNRIAVRFAYEWHDDSGNWYRS